MGYDNEARTLADATITDRFLFACVMEDPEICKELLERVLEIKINHVVVNKEKTIEFTSDFHGIRVDIYADDEDGTVYDVEMQVERTAIEKRSRYYHAQMDMDLLDKGADYNKLPTSYVIFICDYDPFKMRKYRYTVKKTFTEAPDYDYNDGVKTMILSAVGTNDNEVPPELVKFLHYVHASLEDSEKDFEDDFVRRIQERVKTIKQDREMGMKYMLVKDLIREEKEISFEAGLAEGHEAGLAEGHEAGLAEGHEVGLAEGEKIARISMISDLLKHMTPLEIKEMLDITDEEIELAQNNK